MTRASVQNLKSTGNCQNTALQGAQVFNERAPLIRRIYGGVKIPPQLLRSRISNIDAGFGGTEELRALSQKLYEKYCI